MAIAALGLAGAAPALAWDSLDDPARHGQCGFMQEFPSLGRTTVVVSQDQTQFDADDSVWVIVYNRNWTVHYNDTIGEPVSFASGAVKITVEGPDAVANGVGLSVSFYHLRAFAEAGPRWVTLSKGDAPVARLDFRGFADAWNAFEACRGEKVAARAERDVVDEDEPLDPFAEPAGEAPLRAALSSGHTPAAHARRAASGRRTSATPAH